MKVSKKQAGIAKMNMNRMLMNANFVTIVMKLLVYRITTPTKNIFMRSVILFFTGCLFIVNSALAQQDDCNGNELSTANNKFALDVYKALLKKNEPVFFSPFSIYTALSMTMEGAKGNTLAEMQHTLYNTSGCLKKEIGNTQQKFNQLLAAGDSIRTVNSLWVQKGMDVLPSFYETVQENYNAGLNTTDFINAAEPSRKIINDWVEQQTNNRIKELLAKGVLNKLTRMVLVNAIWFKGKWKNPFTHEATRNDKFYGIKETITTPFMHETMTVNYMEDGTVQAIELPYQSNKLSMIILLPGKGKEEEFENKLQQQADNWLKNMKPQEVAISLPKFRMETGFEASELLKGLGMKEAFSNDADFLGISVKEPLKIDKVIHKAFIQVDEDGTEAAAATAVVMMKITSAMPVQRVVKIFKADRPFTFLLCDRESKTILFMGKMEKP
jgi:serpin B